MPNSSEAVSGQVAFLEGVELQKAGQPVQAATRYRRALCENPGHLQALHLLGVAYRQTGQPFQAVALIGRARAAQPTLSGIGENLGNAARDFHKALQRLCDAERNDEARSWLDLLDRLHRCFPDEVPVLICRTWFTAILRGQDAAVATAIDSIDRFERLEQPDNALLCASILIDLERADRRLLRRVQPTARAVLRRDPDSAIAVFLIFYHFYMEGRLAACLSLANLVRARLTSLDRLQAPSLQVMHLSRGGERFFADAMAIAGAHGVVPRACLNLQDRPVGQGVVFFACDPIYYHRFARRLIRSILKTGRDLTIHVHVIDPDHAIFTDLTALRHEAASGTVALNFSHEQSALLPERVRHFLKTYFACMRFLRLRLIADLYRTPVLVTDADCIAVGDPGDLLALHGKVPVTIMNDGIRSGPTREHNATVFLTDGSPEGMRFAAAVEGYISYFLIGDCPFWMLDQAALFWCHRHFAATGPDPVTLIHSDVFRNWLLLTWGSSKEQQERVLEEGFARL